MIAAGQAELTAVCMRHLNKLPEELDLPFWRVVQLLDASLMIERMDQHNQALAIRVALTSMLPKK